MGQRPRRRPPAALPLTGRHHAAAVALPAQRRARRLQRAGTTAGGWQVTTLPAMTVAQRVQYAVLAISWVALSAWFWAWWNVPGTAGSPVLYEILSVPLAYNVTVLPGFYLFYLGQMRRPAPADVRRAEAAGVIGRVAVISLTVPGAESLEIVERQLAAMSAISYPHDSWILVDKEHSPAIAELAARYGVYYFCRADAGTWGEELVTRWNAAGPPFAARTKAGNVNSWLDRYGDGYSHFVQLDIDHRPVPGYLDKVLGYFADPRVAWVQSPSVYGNHEHWTARGASEQEVVLQGPLQMGFFGFCRTPFIIGSHCAYDMRAIRDIGGFQPTRAEDHLDTVCLAAAGRQGVYLPEVIATGDGPETFGTYLAQQFAWSFSMISVLMRYTPRLVWRYTPRQALQFLFVQTWYTFWSLSMLALVSAPLLSLALNEPISRVTFAGFLEHSLPAATVSTMIWWWSRTWHQPRGVALSWRGIALHVARWVIVLSAFAQVLLRVRKPYMVTVKGQAAGSREPVRLAVLAPYLVLFAASLAACWLYLACYSAGTCQGYLFFGVEEAALFWLLIVIVLAQDARELTRVSAARRRRLRVRLRPVLVAGAMAGLLAVTAAACLGRMEQALLGGASWPFW